MSQFSPGTPYVPGSGQVSGTGGAVESQQNVLRQALQAVSFTGSYLGTGQVIVFGPFLGNSGLLYARVIGPISSYAYVFVGQGTAPDLVKPENLESFTVAGSGDEASWQRPGLPIYDGWSVAIFWDKSLAWGQATGKIYTRQVAT
jgi:hypothetical protein